LGLAEPVSRNEEIKIWSPCLYGVKSIPASHLLYLLLHCLYCMQSESLQREVLDLQSEFEFDRIDYLDTIRKQEQEMQWLQSVIERLLPVIRRDCNYINLERIRAQSTWDENSQAWNLPKLTIEKTQLPPARLY